MVAGSPCQEYDPADAHPSAHQSVLESANPRMDSERCASGCPWSTARATAPSPGQPTPGVVKRDKSSRGSVDTTKTRSGPQRVSMCSGERPIGTAKGKQSDTEALCQPPTPPIHTPPGHRPGGSNGGHGGRSPPGNTRAPQGVGCNGPCDEGGAHRPLTHCYAQDESNLGICFKGTRACESRGQCATLHSRRLPPGSPVVQGRDKG